MFNYNKSNITNKKLQENLKKNIKNTIKSIKQYKESKVENKKNH